MQKSTVKQVQGSKSSATVREKVQGSKFRKALTEKSKIKFRSLCHQLYKEVSFRWISRIEQNSRSAFSKKPLPFIELLMEKFTKKQLQDANFSFCYLCSREQNVKFSVLKQLPHNSRSSFQRSLSSFKKFKELNWKPLSFLVVAYEKIHKETSSRKQT